MKTQFIKTSKQDFIDDLRLELIKWKIKYRKASNRSKEKTIAEFRLKEIMTELLKLQVNQYEDWT
jgi:hypothetical protein